MSTTQVTRVRRSQAPKTFVKVIREGQPLDLGGLRTSSSALKLASSEPLEGRRCFGFG